MDTFCKKILQFNSYFICIRLFFNWLKYGMKIERRLLNRLEVY